MNLFNVVGKLFSTALGKCLVVLAGVCLVLGGLLFWERQNSAGLSERIGGNEIVIAGQARALEELRLERNRLESALIYRETEHAEIRKELERARARLGAAVRHDQASLEWFAAPLPEPVLGLLGEYGNGRITEQDAAAGRADDGGKSGL